MIAFIRSNLTILAISAVLIVAAFVLGQCTGAANERTRNERDRAEANAVATERDAKAKEAASEQRAKDIASIEAKHEEQVNAIQGTTADDVRFNAACQRLRASGREGAALPERCRPAG